MKHSFLFLIALIIWILPQEAMAKGNITGAATGQALGTIDFDPTFSDPNYQNTFNSDFHTAIYEFSDNTDSVTVCDETGCYLTGFAWSESVGWLVFNGKTLDYVLTNQGQPDSYYVSDYPKAHFNYDGSNRFPITGFVWSEYGGWISLSSDTLTASPSDDGSSGPVGTTRDAADQAADETQGWGVWLDTNTLTLHGYAWGQYVGWINFDGVSTAWVPDETPPEVLGVNGAWFKNDNINYLFDWPSFAEDQESRIVDAQLRLVPGGGSEFANCPADEGYKEYVDATHEQINVIAPAAGFIQYNSVGYCQYDVTGWIRNGAGMTRFLTSQTVADLQAAGFTVADASWITQPIRMYIHAGDPINTTAASLTLPSSDVVADGLDTALYTLNLKDIGQNPVVPVQTNNQRQVSLTVNFQNQTYFDSVMTDGNGLNNLSSGTDTFTPVRVSDTGIGAATELEDSVGILNLNYASPFGLTLGAYELEWASYAPTIGLKDNINNLTLNSYQATLTDAATPHVSVRVSDEPDTVVVAGVGASTNPLPTLDINQAISFLPAFYTANAEIPSGVLTHASDATVDYDLLNRSSQLLANYSIDDIFEFSDAPGSGGGALCTAACMEVVNIQASGLTSEPSYNGTSPVYAWTNPDLALTRYEIYRGSYYDESISGENPPFVNAFTATPNQEGVYTVDTIWNIPSEDEGFIDRSDSANNIAPLVGATSPDTPSQEGRTIGFRPQNSVGLSLSNVLFQLSQQIAYRYGDQSMFTVYEPASPILTNVAVQDTGVQYTGVATGQQIFETRDQGFDVIGSGANLNLQEQIRRNVASLTTNRTPCSVSGNFPIAELPTTSPCVIADNNTKNAILYYQGGPNDSLVLDNGINPIVVPDWKYTIILTGGANLYIKSNLAYATAGTRGSLGFILLQADTATSNMVSQTDRGANVFIDPTPTNIVGNLYAEGSLMSYNDGGFFYGSNAAPVNALRNQLYWQGSIASRNTIGGGRLSTLPDGKGCTDGSRAQDCANRFDLDFIRRFAVVGDLPADPGSLLSGGGSCAGGNCSPGTLPTTISLAGARIDAGNSKSTDAFFIEKDALLDSNPPPGFATTGSTQSTRTIR